MSEQECHVTSRIPRKPAALGSTLKRWRGWVQAGFLLVWLAPLGRWAQSLPGCVFHCYSCPLSSFACPVGVAANYAALFPAALEVPCLLLGVLVLAGAVGGSLLCGWACPFGFLQDLIGKCTRSKIELPGWVGYGRYGVLAGLVILLPLFLGYTGVPYDEQTVSICRVCPAGALEAGLPYSIRSVWTGGVWLMSWYKSVILAGFILAALWVDRPWCRVLCPLGGWLALFNRWSLFHLRFSAPACVECNLCRTRCRYGVNVDQAVNVSGCIRCLECTACGAIQPALALPESAPAEGSEKPG